MRRFTATLLAGSVLLLACGSDDDADAPSTDAPSTESPATQPPATEPPASEPAESEAPPPVAAPVPVTLVEWAVETETSLDAGPIRFEITNGGEFPHEFGIARGPSYEELPLLDNGAIDEAALGADFLGKIDRLESGGSVSTEFDLTPGTYVFFCNIVAGPNSHAAQGQVVTVTVN
jgi:hypothetical protein